MNIEICRKSSQLSQSSFSIFILFLLRLPSQFIGMFIVCIEDEIGGIASNATVAQHNDFHLKTYARMWSFHGIGHPSDMQCGHNFPQMEWDAAQYRSISRNGYRYYPLLWRCHQNNILDSVINSHVQPTLSDHPDSDASTGFKTWWVHGRVFFSPFFWVLLEEFVIAKIFHLNFAIYYFPIER